MRNLYVILPRSETFVAKVARKLTKYPYSHVTLSLDDDLEVFYSYSRLRNDSPLISGFAKEYRSHLASKEGVKLTCKIFKIPITNTEYKKIKKFISDNEKDDLMLFNYLSMATLTIIGGFEVHKTQNCCGFVAQALELTDKIKLDKPYYRYLPEDFDKMLSEKYLFFEGELDTDFKYDDDYYFDKTKFKDKIFISLYLMKETFYRLFFKKVSKNFRKRELKK